MKRASLENLTKIDTNQVSPGQREVRLVAKIRNELPKLPFFFEYYRALGVRRFFCIDDHSTDQSASYLLSQPDCHVFRPSNSYSEAKSGAAWENTLLDTYCLNCWALVVDADELLVFPHCERASIVDLCAHLDNVGASAMFGFLLDLYPNGDLTTAVFKPGVPFYQICDHYDIEYKFGPRPLLRFSRLKVPAVEVVGGPRWREFYKRQRDDTLLRQIANRFIWKVSALGTRLLGTKLDLPHKAPALFKVPLVKWRKGNARLSSHHLTDTVKLSEMTCALLHFKFFSHLHLRALEEVRRGQMYAGGGEYRRYLNKIAHNPHISFMYEGSRKYTSSDDLIRYGLMRSETDWDHLVKA